MDLRITIRSGYFWAGIGLVLAKVMKVAKEIRPGDKKRGAAPAGGRAALWSAGGWSGRSTGGRYGAVGCQNRKGEG